MTCYSYTAVCPLVQGDNSGALATGLSTARADKPCYNYLYATLISVDLAQNEIFCAKVCDFRQRWYKTKIAYIVYNTNLFI